MNLSKNIEWGKKSTSQKTINDIIPLCKAQRQRKINTRLFRPSCSLVMNFLFKKKEKE